MFFGYDIDFLAIAVLILAGILVLSTYLSTTEEEDRKFIIRNGKVYAIVAVITILSVGIALKNVYVIMVPLMLFGGAFGSNEARNSAYHENEEANAFAEDETQTLRQPYLIYDGEELSFTNEEIAVVLEKRFAYFGYLNEEEKQIFIFRVQKFLDKKTFCIHDESGFKEMPILISASAIALSFGLQKFLLESIDEIHVYPDAFVYAYPFPRALEGNVTGNCLSLSWKHFLDGCTYPTDGQHVGLHELAHAYQQEFCASPLMIDYDFIANFNEFRQQASLTIIEEKFASDKLYTDYALQNVDEFWACSIELFFEKPLDLKIKFPLIYDNICKLLKQDILKRMVS